MKQCERCGIDEDDPRAQQACAAVDSPSPYHLFSEPAIDYDGIAARWDKLAADLEEAGENAGPCELCHTSPCVCYIDDDGKRVGPLR